LIQEGAQAAEQHKDFTSAVGGAVLTASAAIRFDMRGSGVPYIPPEYMFVGSYIQVFVNEPIYPAM
jgi:hypothetical protein